MFEDFDFKYDTNELRGKAKIIVIGVGGGGCNAVNRMVNYKIPGVQFIVTNTDAQQLNVSPTPNKIILGKKLTKGLGAGSDPSIGRKAAEETSEEIKQALKNADLVFVAAAMGGGTGTGAAPVVARLAREIGALVVGVVTTPFQFEGKERIANANIGLSEFVKEVDSYIIISNERLLLELGGVPLADSFKYCDSILKQAVRTITDLIMLPSLVNLDFADVKKVMKNSGPAIIGIGSPKDVDSENQAIDATIDAINSPIVDTSIRGAKAAIVNITGGKNLKTSYINDAVDTLKEAANNDIDVIFGAQFKEELDDRIIVSVIVTGLKGRDSYIQNKLHQNNLYQNYLDNNRNKQNQVLFNNQSEQPKGDYKANNSNHFVETLEFFDYKATNNQVNFKQQETKKQPETFNERFNKYYSNVDNDLKKENSFSNNEDIDDIPSFMRKGS